MQALRKPTAHAAETITELYARLTAAVAATKAIPTTVGGKLENPAFDRAVDKCAKIAGRIVRSPAVSIDEMLNKIAAAAWCMGVRDLEHWQPGALLSGEEHFALATLRDDLQRLQSGPPAAAVAEGRCYIAPPAAAPRRHS